MTWRVATICLIAMTSGAFAGTDLSESIGAPLGGWERLGVAGLGCGLMFFLWKEERKARQIAESKIEKLYKEARDEIKQSSERQSVALMRSVEVQERHAAAMDRHTIAIDRLETAIRTREV